MDAEKSARLRRFVKAIMDDLKAGAATFHPDIMMITRTHNCPYDDARSIIATILLTHEERRLWKQTTPARGLSKVIADFILWEYEMLLEGRVVSRITLKEMAELFNTTINRSHEILVGMRHAGKLPAVEATRTARERVIANLIRRELNLVRSGLIPRCSTIEEIARFCRLSNETVRFILSKYLDAKKLSFRKRHVRSSASSCLISVSKNNNVREIVAYAKSQADNYRIDEGSGLASYEKMSKEFHVSRERVRQIITKYLPQDLPLWTALQYKSRTRK